jgi:hypothetical protein
MREYCMWPFGCVQFVLTTLKGPASRRHLMRFNNRRAAAALMGYPARRRGC